MPGFGCGVITVSKVTQTKHWTSKTGWPNTSGPPSSTSPPQTTIVSKEDTCTYPYAQCESGSAKLHVSDSSSSYTWPPETTEVKSIEYEEGVDKKVHKFYLVTRTTTTYTLKSNWHVYACIPQERLAQLKDAFQGLQPYLPDAESSYEFVISEDEERAEVTPV
jgi:hypothetical protein